MKLMPICAQDGTTVGYMFWCPGCKSAHPYYVRTHPQAHSKNIVWGFNGDVEKPTFTPSLLMFRSHYQDGRVAQPLCHIFLTDGVIQFLADCEHELKGQSVPLPDWPY